MRNHFERVTETEDCDAVKILRFVLKIHDSTEPAPLERTDFGVPVNLKKKKFQKPVQTHPAGFDEFIIVKQTTNRARIWGGDRRRYDY